jgi:transposase-like protein
MVMCKLNAQHLKNEDKARAYLESLRWPSGKPTCPHCGVIGDHYALEGEAHRPGLWKCSACRQQFSVTVGTVFERSKIPLTKWLMAVHLLCSSKKGMSSHQLHRTLGVTYKTAWFMSHRIREAMKAEGGIMGAGGGTVEADETYIGRKPGTKKAHAGFGHKNTVFALVERSGRVQSRHISGAKFDAIKEELRANVAPEAKLMTDEAKMYRNVGKDFAQHEVVKHSQREYVRGNAHTNTVEGYFSIFKRGMNGVYQHCRSNHLHRYLAEFDFRYNYRTAAGYEDSERSEMALKGIGGKRLMYRDSFGA